MPDKREVGVRRGSDEGWQELGGSSGEQEKAGPETGGCWWQRPWRGEKILGLYAKVSGKLSSHFKQVRDMNWVVF